MSLSKIIEIFNEVDKEVIETNKELCEGMSVNGIEITCFILLSNLLNGRQELNELDKQTILTVYKQLSLYCNFWSEYDWFDNSSNLTIKKKFKKLLKEQLKIRR